MKLELLYQDDAILVFNKPSGLLSVPGLGAANQDSLATRALQYSAQAKIVHRLDCHTSGVMLMAVGIAAQRELSRQFHDRETHKRYIAVVHGKVAAQSGEIKLAMRLDPNDRPRQVLDAVHGKAATTRWQVLAYEETPQGPQTRLDLILVTGRTHQLRVHCSALGHAIVGDGLYGPPAQQGQRMLLHAEQLTFTHPRTAQQLLMTAGCDF